VRRIALLLATCALAGWCASCGSGAGGTGAAQETGATTAAEQSEIDYGGLAEYDCERLEELLDDVIGPGDHGGMPHAESWTAGTDYKGGCVFENAEVSVEIHLAEPDQHSFEWSLGAPERAAERDEKSVDVGDEAYVDAVGDGVALVARKGLVELRLGAPISGDESMSSEGMIALGRAILEPWPSGPGAQESDRPEPPGVPLPPGVARGDFEYFDAKDFNEKVEEAGGNFEDAKLDPELVPSTFTVTFPASPGQARRYCDDLRAAGIDIELADALASKLGVAAEGSGGGTDEDPCDLTDEEIVATVDRSIDGYTLSLADWDALVRQVGICRETPERCEEE
jgi:hypothetical protein